MSNATGGERCGQGLFEWAYEVKRGSVAVVKSSVWEKRDTYDVELI